jgi:hypothetical protein
MAAPAAEKDNRQWGVVHMEYRGYSEAYTVKNVFGPFTKDEADDFESNYQPLAPSDYVSIVKMLAYKQNHKYKIKNQQHPND